MNQYEQELIKTLQASLECYSNVHRGSGHFSQATTRIYEEARAIVRKHLRVSSGYEVIFCSGRRARTLIRNLEAGEYILLSSRDLGLAIGLYVLVIRKRLLKKLFMPDTGGGTAGLMAVDWVINAGSPDFYEAGTPAIIPVILFARALELSGQSEDHPEITSSQAPVDFNQITENLLNKKTGIEALELVREEVIGKKFMVHTSRGFLPFINLDNAASTQTFTPVVETYKKLLFSDEQSKTIVDDVRKVISEFTKAPHADYDIIFTSNATEAINIVARSFAGQHQVNDKPIIINSIAEHSSNDLPWRMVPDARVLKISINSNGDYDLRQLENLLQSHKVDLVSLSAASNVTGTRTRIHEICRMVHQYGSRILVDMAQLIAHHPVDLEQLEADFVAFSAHKIYAPFGTGVLIARKGLLKYNADEYQQIIASGEENRAGIASLGTSLVIMKNIGMQVIADEEKKLTLLAMEKLSGVKGIKVFGIKHTDQQNFDRHLGVISFTLNKKMSDVVAKELARTSGIGIRYGCHCAHILVKHLLNVSPGLQKFQRFIQSIFKNVPFPGVARISLALYNTSAEIERLGEAIDRIEKNKDSDLYPETSKKLTKQQIENFVQDRINQVFSR